MCIPVSLKLGNVGLNPVELIYADLLVIISLFVFLNIKLNKIIIMYIVFVAYCILISFVSSILWSSLDPIVSMLRYIKSTHLIVFGIMFGRVMNVRVLYRALSIILGVVVVIILISDVLNNEAFPYGRVGRWFLWYEVYGFPNALSSYLAVFSAFLFYSYFNDKNKFISFISLALAMLLGFIVVSTLSRNGIAIYVLSLLFSCAAWCGREYKKAVFLIVIYLMAFFASYDVLLNNNGLLLKFNSLVGENPLSDRDLIWDYAFQSIVSSPLFGSGFYSFSNLGFEFKTLHSMYFDVIYKMGFLGFSFLMLLLFMPLFRMSKYRSSQYYSELKLYLLVLILVCISGFSQEALGFSLLQSLVFFLCGYMYTFRWEKIDEK